MAAKPKVQMIGQRIQPMKDRVQTLVGTATGDGPSWRADRRKTAERGYGARWQKARLQHLAMEPLCRYCQRMDGRITVASAVDHEVPHRGDMALFWKRENWISLCASCHSGRAQQRDNGRAPGRGVGPDGWPV